MFINILLKIHFEVDKQLSIMYYMLSLKETFLRRSINEYCYHSFLCRNYWCNDVFPVSYTHLKRFDRNNNKKIHMHTLGAISHIDYNIPGLCSYEQAAYYMNRLGIPYSDVEQFYRRMVFNVILINQDDHVKNVSFLMDKNGVWRLSPAYDVTFAYDSSNCLLYTSRCV